MIRSWGRVAAIGLLAGMMTLASAVRAELLRTTVDVAGSSVNATLDTESGLHWLDVGLTANQSLDDVRRGPLYGAGFRHATQEELRALFVRAQLVEDNFDISFTQPQEALALIELLGATHLGEGGSAATFGYLGTDYFGQAVTPETHPVGQPFSALVGKIEYILLAERPPIGEAHFAGWHTFSDERHPFLGNFLVRHVDAACRTVGRSPNLKCDGQGRGQYR
jgi:hypothetical protein